MLGFNISNKKKYAGTLNKYYFHSFMIKCVILIFQQNLEILVIVLPTVRFVGILAQNLSSNRDMKNNEFRTIKILTYQYLVPLVSLT